MGRIIISIVMLFLALPLILAYCSQPVSGKTIHTIYLPQIVDSRQVPEKQVRVIFADTGIVGFTAEELQRSRHLVRKAFRYWIELSPIPPAITWQGLEDRIRVEDPYSSWQWAKELNHPDYLTITIVSNRDSRKMLASPYGPVYAWNWAGEQLIVLSLTDTIHDPQFVGYVTAHELGHYFFPMLTHKFDRKSIMAYGREAWYEWYFHPDDRTEICRHYQTCH